jgi:hypothetical protein
VDLILSSPFLMGNAQITPRDPVSVSEASSSQEDERASTTRTLTHSVHANASGLESTTPDETTKYLPKGMNRSNKNGVVMPSGPSVSGGPSPADGIESPQWGWYISITPPTPDIYHRGSRQPLYKKQDSSANASQASSDTAASESSTATSHQPNRIFQEMHSKRKYGASMGWSSVPPL